ncbi:MAG: hypothetical protein A2V98_21190 [Planctomycetes bacterium RBG_16_64_12]|nr:MAG: hypothetical protein A2V98_21190 [Planctomycetes bacterium RBG_16_64_12]
MNNTRISATLKGKPPTAAVVGALWGPTTATPTMANSPNALTVVSTFCAHFPPRTPTMLTAVNTATAATA